MTNNKLAAQCLIEAASLLGESAGANGFGERRNRERSKHLQDKINKAQKMYDKYKRAGYEDKCEDIYSDIQELKEAKQRTDWLALRNHNASHISKSEYGDGNTDLAKMARNSADLSKHHVYYNHSKPTKNKELHDRINSRAKAKNETAAECYLRAAQLLDESYDVYDDYDLY